jgi:hypothetical protein
MGVRGLWMINCPRGKQIHRVPAKPKHTLVLIIWNIIALWKVEAKRVETKTTDELSVVGIWRDETNTIVEAARALGAWSREHQVPCRKDNICRICVPFLSRISRRTRMSSTSSWTSNTRSCWIARLSWNFVLEMQSEQKCGWSGGFSQWTKVSS